MGKESLALTNQEIAKMLREVAGAYEVRGGSFFRVRAYQNAVSAVEHATSAVKDLWDDGKLGELPGVGQGIAAHLDELFRKGEVAHWEEVKENLPKGMFVFLEIPGVGAKSAYRLAKELKVQSLEELKEATEKGQVRKLPGFGEKSETEILKGIEELGRKSKRMLLPQAMEMAGQIVPKLQKLLGVVRVDALGSVRRRVATVGDLDLAVAVRDKFDMLDVIEAFVKLKGIQKVEEKGEKEAAVIWGNGRRVDLRVQEEESYGALLQHYTGSKQHNIHLRKVAQEKGWSLSEYGIRKTESRKQKTEAGKQKTEDRLKRFKTEEEFYQFLGMEWIPPELREDTGEIEAALKGKLPQLVELKDIKGDLHLHCDFDLEESHDPGRSSMEEIARKAGELGYEYVVVGNHNPSVYNHTEKQMVELIQRKQHQINAAGEQFPCKPAVELQLLNGVEVDILADGKLAMPDAALKLLDVVVVSIHSGMRQNRDKLTKRVISALKNPHTHILGHPTGRLLGQREGYELDWEQVFAVAKEYHKAIEINSFYNRLDLPDTLAREAVQEGVKLVINTDAHHVSQMDLMEFGVSVARRGWAEKKDILNTLPWEGLRDFLQFARY